MLVPIARVVVGMLVRLFLSLFVDRSSLLDAGIVALPLHFGVWREGENALHRLPA